ncbi:hypothetical protein HK102_010329, partial [Quaeritorhiza haematococci]
MALHNDNDDDGVHSAGPQTGDSDILFLILGALTLLLVHFVNKFISRGRGGEGNVKPGERAGTGAKTDSKGKGGKEKEKEKQGFSAI